MENQSKLDTTNPPKGGSGVPNLNRKFTVYYEAEIEVKDTLESELTPDDEIIDAIKRDYSQPVKTRQFRVTPTLVEVEKNEPKPKNQYNPDYAVHPGEILREHLAALTIETRNDLNISLVLDCFGIMIEADSVSNEVAKELAELFGTSKEMWIKLQKQWDERNNAENS